MQTAGNQLEETVGKLGEEALMVRLDHNEKLENIAAHQRNVDKEITQLQKDMVEQDMINKEQHDRITHLEKIIEDLVGRITKIEDKA